MQKSVQLIKRSNKLMFNLLIIVGSESWREAEGMQWTVLHIRIHKSQRYVQNSVNNFAKIFDYVTLT